jgi:hypothetical protein
MASEIKSDKLSPSTGTALQIGDASDTITIPTGATLTVTDGIPVASGGTGLASFTAGDILYATGSTTLAKLGKGTAEQVLAMNSGATAPDWGSVDLTVLPTITVAKGGTNLSSFTAGDLLYATGSTTLAKLAKGTGSQTLKMNSGATAPEWVTAGGGAFENNLLHIVHESADGTSGGASVASAWTKGTISTIKTNEITSATLSSDVISLPAGDYYAQCNAYLTNSGYIQIRLRDTTNSASLVVGTNGYCEGSASTTGFANGRFTLSGTANVELQYYVTTAYSNGQGFASPGSGEVNRFKDVQIWKL